MPTTTFTIASAADFNTALATINTGGANAAANTTYAFNLTAGFTLDRNLAAIKLVAGSTLNISGGSGVTINGANAFSGFNAQTGSVNISHVTIVEMLARGADAGVSPGGGGGGGAAGLGG